MLEAVFEETGIQTLMGKAGDALTSLPLGRVGICLVGILCFGFVWVLVFCMVERGYYCEMKKRGKENNKDHFYLSVLLRLNW